MEALALPVLAIVAGVVSVSSPCCLPLVPGVHRARPRHHPGHRRGRRDGAWGAALLILYSLGLGVPFVLLALGFARAQRSLQWLRRNGRRMEVAGGALLVGVGVLFVTGRWMGLFRPLQRWFAELGWRPI
ncbi:MAG: cytochrome c biogenesis protein CcdA [Actinomycetota bacterium]|nr:cytochrome c biogenesis protein CcdA [Actinomycetota bacterium]